MRRTLFLVVLCIAGCGTHSATTETEPNSPTTESAAQAPTTQPQRSKIDPNDPKQVMDWILGKLDVGGDNCQLIANNIRSFVSATGRSESPQINQMLHTARQIGCI
jgi:hypothetical protein